jgi:hypothetical protein
MKKCNSHKIGKIRYSNCLITSLFIYFRFWKKSPKIRKVYFHNHPNPHFYVEIGKNIYSFYPVKSVDAFFKILCFKGYVNVRRKR